MVALLLSVAALPVSAGPHEQIVGRYLAGLGFSRAINAIEEGDPLLTDSVVVVGLLLARPGWVTDPEGEWIIERAFLRELDKESNDSVVDQVLSLLTAEFSQLVSWSLRALILRQARSRTVTGIEMAVADSAHRISSLLRESRDGHVSEPYEREAVALAEVAPHFPSVALAELLRTVAMFSADPAVVAAVNSSALAMLGADSLK